MLGDDLNQLHGPIFITGHTGFKGAWLSLLLDHLGIEHFGYSLQAEENSLFIRANLESKSKGVVADIRDLENLSRVLKRARPSVVIHLAAQPLVLKSYREPLVTFQTNCLGTANILEAAFDVPSIEIVLVITTDKVYKNSDAGRRFVESDTLEGRDPYSASKVGAEAACIAWQQIYKTFGGPKVIIARAGNVIGGGDFAEDRVIPDIIRGVIRNQPTLIRNPRSTRPWQHVLDPLAGYLLYIEQTLQQKVDIRALNFGPSDPSLEVGEVVRISKEVLGNFAKFAFTDEGADKEAKLLELDSSLANQSLSWFPRWSQRDAIFDTFLWWRRVLSNPRDAYGSCLDNINSLLTRMYQ